MYCFSKFCRFCVRKDCNLINLFCIDEDMMMYSEKIRCLIPEIVFEEDNIPNIICDECCNHIRKLYEFKKMCIKNTEILKLYASKLLSIKGITDTDDINVLEKFLKDIDSKIDHSIILIKKNSNTQNETNEHVDIHNYNESSDKYSVSIKSEQENDSCSNNLDDKDMSVKDEEISLDEEPLCLENKNKEHVYSERFCDELNKNESTTQKRSVIKQTYNAIVNPVLQKFEYTEEEDSCSEDQGEEQGDESMDCDDVISVNDSEIENNDDDLIKIPEPMNLTARVLNPIMGNVEANTTTLPSFLTSGNRGKTRTNDKYRVVYTEHQRLELEKEYLLNRFIADRRRAELAISLGLTVRQIKIWFQNRRAKERKEAKRSDNLSENSQNASPKMPSKIDSKSSVTTAIAENITKRRPSLELSVVPATTASSRNQKSTTEKHTNSSSSSSSSSSSTAAVQQSDELLRKQQEYFIQQQIIQQQQELMLQEQLLRQRKEFITQQQQLLQKEFHQQLYPHQQDILRQEEYIRQQKQFFNQQQLLLQQRTISPETLIQATMLNSQLILNQPLLMRNQNLLLTNQAAMLPNLILSNTLNLTNQQQQQQQQSGANTHSQTQQQSAEAVELVKSKKSDVIDLVTEKNDSNNKKTSSTIKELMPNLDELFKRKQELIKKHEEINTKSKK